jgi:hypothetical protein
LQGVVVTNAFSVSGFKPTPDMFSGLRAGDVYYTIEGDSNSIVQGTFNNLDTAQIVVRMLGSNNTKTVRMDAFVHAQANAVYMFNVDRIYFELIHLSQSA